MNNNGEYWKERFRQLENAQNDVSMAKAQEIQEQFERTQAAISGKINAWYQRIADNNGVSMAEAKKMLSAQELKEFRWNVEDYIKYGKENAKNHAWEKQLENASARVHISRLEALKLEVQQEMEKLYGNYLDSVDRHIKDTYISDFYHTAYEIQKGIGIGSRLHQLDTNLIEKIICKPWAVDGKNFSERIWENKTKLINQVYNSLSRMCITGEAPDRAISEIAKNMKVSRQQAGTLVMTEAAAFASEAREDCMKELGVQEFEIVETLDSITCTYCQSMDGKHYKMSDFQIGVTAPPFHPRCRGCTCPHFDDEFTVDEKRAARGEDGKTYYVPADMSYPEWKKSFVDSKKNENADKKADYLIRNHISGQNISKERRMVNEAIASVPQKVQQTLKNTVIDVGKDGASQYDYVHDILYVAKGADKEAVIHEIGHMVENKLLDKQKVLKLKRQILEKVILDNFKKEIYYDASNNPVEIFLVTSDSFVSEYQGRVYIDDWSELLGEDMCIKPELLAEFISEPFREYIEHPERLKTEFPQFYDLMKEAIE